MTQDVKKKKRKKREGPVFDKHSSEFFVSHIIRVSVFLPINSGPHPIYTFRRRVGWVTRQGRSHRIFFFFAMLVFFYLHFLLYDIPRGDPLHYVAASHHVCVKFISTRKKKKKNDLVADAVPRVAAQSEQPADRQGRRGKRGEDLRPVPVHDVVGRER